MAIDRNHSAGSSSKALGLIWLLVSAGLAYPAYSMLVSVGFNQGLAMVAVFIGACLLYDIPYRARKNAEHQAAMVRADKWRNRSC
jgi:ABC-type polysaccharide/polyol phosphate export permease